jgi:hypothetical protein
VVVDGTFFVRDMNNVGYYHNNRQWPKMLEPMIGQNRPFPARVFPQNETIDEDGKPRMLFHVGANDANQTPVRPNAEIKMGGWIVLPKERQSARPATRQTIGQSSTGLAFGDIGFTVSQQLSLPRGLKSMPSE